MNLQRTEAPPEILMLLARDLLVAEKQHLMIEEGRAHLREVSSSAVQDELPQPRRPSAPAIRLTEISAQRS